MIMNTFLKLRKNDYNYWFIRDIAFLQSLFWILIDVDDFRVRVYDTRTSNPVASFTGHMYQITTVQMDDWKVISGGYDGFVFVWDLRMTRKLWEIHNRYKNICCVSLNLGQKKKNEYGIESGKY